MPDRFCVRKWTLVALLAVSAGGAQAEDDPPDPSKEEVFLECAEGWECALVLDNGKTGIWTVDAFNVFPQYGTPEIIGLDDEGRCHVMIGYSGKWTDKEVIHDGAWLGGLSFGDIDPRIEGPELYTGGQKGHLYQVNGYKEGVLDCRLISILPGREIHTIVAEDLDGTKPGRELLVFTRPGGIFSLSPTGEHGRFVTEQILEVDGRVRDAQVLPAPDGAPKEIATVSRNGRLEILRFQDGEPKFETIYEAPMGLGRIEMSERSTIQHVVLYSSHDDGRILRHERAGRRAWTTECIYYGPQGARGIATGVFSTGDQETVVVFGYSGRVEMLTRQASGWKRELIFEDRDKGHWLKAIEVDGRNTTREIVGSGYGGRIFLLKRPPGYGFSEETPSEPVHAPEMKPETEPSEKTGRAKEPAPPKGAAAQPASLRIAVRANPDQLERLTPLSYSGGFQTKTAVYETLVRRADDGSIIPALARTWRFEDQGRALILELDEAAHYHDGTPVTSQSVVWHLRRWVGLPEHSWLGLADRVRSVDIAGASAVRLTLDRPWAALADLCAINPAAVQGPGALDGEGKFVRPIGSGPFRYLGSEGAISRYEEMASERVLEMHSVDSAEEAMELLESGEIDLVYDGWYELVPREVARRYARDIAWQVRAVPGSSVFYLSFGGEVDRETRRAIARAVDRGALIRDVELGYADATSSWAARALTTWPRSRYEGEAPKRMKSDVTLTLIVDEANERRVALAESLRDQLAGVVTLKVAPLSAKDLGNRVRQGDYDIRIERTWGSPYDPELSLRARFLPPPSLPNASSERFFGVDPRLTELVAISQGIVDDAARHQVYRQIQDFLDAEAVIVPLYSPQRLMIARLGVPLPRLGTDLYRADFDVHSGDPECPTLETEHESDSNESIEAVEGHCTPLLLTPGALILKIVV
ncbi:MAG: ABC transporter substrate-binding protein [Planctomycetota bacterium]